MIKLIFRKTVLTTLNKNQLSKRIYSDLNDPKLSSKQIFSAQNEMENRKVEKKPPNSVTSFDIFELEGTSIDSYSERGFVINGKYLNGPMIIFPDYYWSWKVKKLSDINFETLSPIWLHNPTPRMFLLFYKNL